MGGKKRAKKTPGVLHNTALSDALQTQDVAAVAFALRHGPTVAPILGTDQGEDVGEPGAVWTFRDPQTGSVSLLLFSDARHMPETLPSGSALRSPAWLRTFLAAHEGVIDTVFFDVAGPHPMQAKPADLIAALEA